MWGSSLQMLNELVLPMLKTSWRFLDYRLPIDAGGACDGVRGLPAGGEGDWGFGWGDGVPIIARRGVAVMVKAGGVALYSLL